MIDRIRERFFRLHRVKDPTQRQPAALRGIVHNIIAVKAPNDIFTEAIFILKDDYCLNSSLSGEELLRQAREAANLYTVSVSVKERWKMILLAVLTVLLCAETVGLIVLL